MLPVMADDIAMSSEQSDYYYLIGTEAKVPFTIDSGYSNTLVGTLQYSLTKHQDEGGLSISQTSTKSQSFPVAPGKSAHALTLSAESETVYDLSLMLMYTQNGQDLAVVLPAISVHFVSDSKDISQQKNTVRSSTSPVTKTPASLVSSDPFSAMDRQMEQVRKEQEELLQNLLSQSGQQMNSRSPQAMQNPQQALQNNQMSTSSSSLMQQMIKESQQMREDKEKLSSVLEKDPLIMNQVSELKEAGYNQTNGRIVSTGPESGEFFIDFENADGNKVSVTGEAIENQVFTLSAETFGEIPAPNELASNTTWKEMKESLHTNAMTESTGIVTRTPTNITVTQYYISPDGRNATLSARIANGSVEEIKMVRDEPFPIFWLAGLFLVIILIVLCAGVAWWYYSTREENHQLNEEPFITPIDYREIVREMMEKSEISYAAGDKKEGYVLLGQALRTYISFRYGSGQAMTSEEILSGKLGLNNTEKKIIHDILQSCTIVEYVKGEPDDNEYFTILKAAKDLMVFDN